MPSAIPPAQPHWPRGPSKNELHAAAYHGSTERTIALLSRGLINIDQGEPEGFTPLMLAAQRGHSHVVRILLGRRANVSIAADDGVTALHLAAQGRHFAVTIDLVQAGAKLGAEAAGVLAPLNLAARFGHSKVVAALIEAGADIDSRSGDGGTPLCIATLCGHLGAVEELLRARANPLLAMTISGGGTITPLEAAAARNHSKVVRQMIQQVGIGCCGGKSGGVDALTTATVEHHVNIMAMLMDAGVVDTGKALHAAAPTSWEAGAKFLLQRQRQRRGAASDSVVGYVNGRDRAGYTLLLCCIDVIPDAKGVPPLVSPRVVRLLIDAGADTSFAIDFTMSTPGGEVPFNGTPLDFTNHCLREKKVGGVEDAREKQMYRLEAVRRLLLRVEAVHAVSWLWPRETLLASCVAEDSSRTARKTPASGTQLALMLPILRCRRRGMLLAPLFRYSSYP